MRIQWFPGHMTKTKRLIEENIKLVDIVIEIADARLVNSSRSPLLAELIQGKPQILVLNKEDAADERVNALWAEHFEKEKLKVIFTNSRDGGKLAGRIERAACEELASEIQRWRQRGMQGRSIKAMVTGVPNVGKSTFINNISGKKSTKTGDRPGVTTGKQWIKAGRLELLDTPGILSPKFDDETTGEHLAASGAVRDAVYDTCELCIILLGRLKENYSPEICARYKLKSIADMGGLEILEAICKKRGFIVSGGELDIERGANIVLDEFRGAKIGRISLERPF